MRLHLGMGFGSSNVAVTGGAPDTTAPTLSSPVGTQTGQTTATIGATTDEGNGTMYGVVTTSSTAPTATQVKAGQNNGGTAAVFAGSVAVSSTGAKTISATGLTASTAYYAHIMHEDAAGNKSSVVSSAQFTTAAGVATMTFSTTDKTSNASITGGNLTVSENAGGGQYATVRSSRRISAGAKVYAEFSLVSEINEIGVCDGSVTFPGPASNVYWGSSSFPPAVGTSHAVGWHGNDNQLYYNSAYTTIGAFSVPATIGVAWDDAAETIWFTKDGINWLPNGNPASGTGGFTASGLDADHYFYAQPGQSKSITANFGTTAGGTIGFAYTPPSGFVAP